LEDFVGAKLYCLHALADGKQHIRVREKTLEFSIVLSTLSPYLLNKNAEYSYHTISSGSFRDSATVDFETKLHHYAPAPDIASVLYICIICTS